jgi:hypothetical protein
MGDGEFARPHLAAAAVDLDLGDDRHHRTRALGMGDVVPVRMSLLWSARGEGRASHPARSAAAFTTAMSRGAFR